MMVSNAINSVLTAFDGRLSFDTKRNPMAKKKPSHKLGKWYLQLDQDKINATLEEATVDAYGPEE